MSILTLTLTSHPNKIPEICSFVVYHKLPYWEQATEVLKNYPDKEYYHDCPNCVYKIILRNRERVAASKNRVEIPLGVPVLEPEPTFVGKGWQGYGSVKVTLERERVE